MQIVIDIPEQMYLNAKADTLCGADILVNAIKNGTPHETVTEFADRCRECGREKVLDKIRAEIKDWQTDIHDNEYDAESHDFVFERVYEIMDNYKAESEEV